MREDSDDGHLQPPPPEENQETMTGGGGGGGDKEYMNGEGSGGEDVEESRSLNTVAGHSRVRSHQRGLRPGHAEGVLPPRVIITADNRRGQPADDSHAHDRMSYKCPKDGGLYKKEWIGQVLGGRAWSDTSKEDKQLRKKGRIGSDIEMAKEEWKVDIQ
ncbi:hypothetical protein Pcinc_012615 [Petrolisthes cinctipes]|uniref:Uncharacterized protein n=1 Tax=Petrolisthes cinctipes TaxID=88211 RepID=A0AAE1G0L2_PETCI|nr:hypothetical protein Pcinc_012615 [Petrolisthes cinctipes]